MVKLVLCSNPYILDESTAFFFTYGLSEFQSCISEIMWKRFITSFLEGKYYSYKNSIDFQSLSCSKCSSNALMHLLEIYFDGFAFFSAMSYDLKPILNANNMVAFITTKTNLFLK